ncbi:MAG: DUF5615 family PIN-like protein [Acidithiobacillus sp.]|jgi:predicted nuclease of predicted toxin-antitoxin system|uniref:DUF5615 family PIN-like protein n=1 Tax=Acidithiobacillus sp. TaxID=1872118 RepID=UPI002A15B9B3|nr:DUF5615 family PIN-like protein [Acidithiobacillus sp.]
MQFLVDAQLPPALARWISAQGYPACHVADIGMASALDPEIWDRAYGDGAILRAIRPDGPTIIWLRTPNCRRQLLLDGFARLWPQMLDRLNQGETLIELRS